MGGESGKSVIAALLRERKGKYRNSPIAVYFPLAKASDGFQVATKPSMKLFACP
jgi:hypothetical protein